MQTTLNFDFTDSSDYSFDTSEIEITGGKAQLRDRSPNDETFYCNYNTDINGSRGLGVLTGTGVGSPTVSGGKLDLKGNSVKYVEYDAVDNADSLQTLTIEFDYYPNYSGSPSSNKGILYLKDSSGTTSNLIVLNHLSTGFIRLLCRDNTEANIFDIEFSWSPTTGQKYSFSFNIDITGGTSRLFINGNQLGTDISGTGTRTEATLLSLGTNFNQTFTSNFEIDNFAFYNTVKRTQNYTVPDPIEYAYSIDNPYIKTLSIVYIDELINFVETVSSVGNVKYILQKDNSDYYHNGSDWVLSDGTYAQTNTAAEVLANVSTFVSSSKKFNIKVFLNSNGTEQTYIDELSTTVNISAIPEDTTEKCKVYVYPEDILAENWNNSISVSLSRPAVKYKTSKVIIGNEKNIEVENGLWEADLVENENMSSPTTEEIYYIFNINGEIYKKIVPSDELSKNLWELEDYT